MKAIGNVVLWVGIFGTMYLLAQSAIELESPFLMKETAFLMGVLMGLGGVYIIDANS